MGKSELEKALLQGMSEAIAVAKGKKNARTREVVLAPPAPKVSRMKIVYLRKETLKVSQPVFASYLNVSPQTVKAWEQGTRRPDTAALRLLQLFLDRPEELSRFIKAA